jgi:hypothetical protein
MAENYEDYLHPNLDPNLMGVQNAMEYNAAGLPALRVIANLNGWGIQVSNGEIEGVGYIEKFGMNVDVDSNKETIWDAGGIYQYLTTAETVSVTSTLGTDSVTGTGARTVEIQGLDADYNLVYETLTVGGGAGTQEFLRIFRVKVLTAGSSGVNEGTISVTSNGTSTVLAQIGIDGSGGNAAGRGQTFMSLYTVPAGKTAYLTQWTVGAGKQNTDAVAFMMARTFDNGWNSKDIITVSATTYAKDYKIPLKFDEKTDIEVRAYSTTNNSLVSSTFNLILIDNPVEE